MLCLCSCSSWGWACQGPKHVKDGSVTYMLLLNCALKLVEEIILNINSISTDILNAPSKNILSHAEVHEKYLDKHIMAASVFNLIYCHHTPLHHPVRQKSCSKSQYYLNFKLCKQPCKKCWLLVSIKNAGKQEWQSHTYICLLLPEPRFLQTHGQRFKASGTRHCVGKHTMAWFLVIVLLDAQIPFNIFIYSSLHVSSMSCSKHVENYK